MQKSCLALELSKLVKLVGKDVFLHALSYSNWGKPKICNEIALMFTISIKQSSNFRKLIDVVMPVLLHMFQTLKLFLYKFENDVTWLSGFHGYFEIMFSFLACPECFLLTVKYSSCAFVNHFYSPRTLGLIMEEVWGHLLM